MLAVSRRCGAIAPAHSFQGRAALCRCVWTALLPRCQHPWDCGDGVLRYLAASPLSGMPMGARAHFARVGPQHDDCFTDLPICGRLELPMSGRRSRPLSRWSRQADVTEESAAEDGGKSNAD